MARGAGAVPARGAGARLSLRHLSVGRLPSAAELFEKARELASLWGCPELIDGLLIHYNPRMRSRLGSAFLENNRLDLNARLLAEHPDEAWPTFVHELAHLAVVRLFAGRKERPHGIAWARLMRKAGVRPNRLHDLPVRSLARRPFLYLHTCVRCENWWVAGRVRRDLSCASCGPGPVRVMRAPRTARGAAMVERAVSMLQSGRRRRYHVRP